MSKLNESSTVVNDATPSPVEQVFVIGAGTMGRGIAQTIAEAGIATTMYDVDVAGLERGLAAIENQWQNALAKGRRSENDIVRFRSRLQTADSLAPAGRADLTIEAIVENLDAKLALVRDATGLMPAEAIFASN